MLIDTHAHIYDEQYGDGGKAIIADMEADGLGAVITVGCDEQTSRICVELAENNKNVYATVGVHPYYPETVTDRCIASLRALAKSEKVVAVGEFGFDYHHDVFDKAAQMRAAVMQYELAREQFKIPAECWAGHRPCCRRQHTQRGLLCRQRLYGDMGARAPRVARHAGREGELILRCCRLNGTPLNRRHS